MIHQPPTLQGRSAAVDAVHRQIRGSSLLLVGRVLSLAINLVTQVLIVRYLSKAGYGAFAYALSIVAIIQSVSTLGLDRTVPRFVPIHQERGDDRKIVGVLALAVSATMLCGTLFVFGFFALRGMLAPHVIADRQAVSVLLVLIFLAPLQALDGLLMGLLAVFARPRTIFVRTYVLAPGLKLIVVALLIATGSGVVFLAAGYTIATAFGVAVFSGVLIRALRRARILRRSTLRPLYLPIRETFSLALPLLTTNLVYVLLLSSDAVLLGYFHGSAAVASFRVVQPAAAMNDVVMTSFALLFTPVASRLFARGDHVGARHLYWQTAAWIAVASFPIFALTFLGADFVVGALYGSRYSDSAVYLTILSLGYYLQAALGFNGTTLMVYGRVRAIALLNVLAMVVNIALNLALIPRFGALGAAVGTCGTFVVHNALKQFFLRRGTEIPMLDRRFRRMYASVAGAAAGMIIVRIFADHHALTELAAAGVASLAVIVLNRTQLRVGDTFPELLRVPILRRFFER